MLVLSRKSGQSIVIDGQIIVHVVGVSRGRVHLGITAPPHLPIYRSELFERIQAEAASKQAGREFDVELEVTSS